jgi:4-hydroxyphenylpyruvate dioxygenase
MQQLATYPARTSTDFLPLKGIDHLEFYVGNAKQAAYFYRRAFGLALTAYRGPETGTRDRVSYVLEQNQIRFVLTTPLDPESIMAGHILRHGDGVKSIALTVDDAAAAYRETTQRGALGVTSPAVLRDDAGEARLSSIAAYGNTVHTFVERANYRGAFLPGFIAVPGPDPLAQYTGLVSIDHTVGNVGLGEMNKWVEFYERVMGFSVYQTFDDHDISTEYSSLMSKVVSNGGGWIKFPINEPAHGRKKSQIEEYLDAYRGPGVQHLALATDDIVFTVSQLSQRGVEFLKVPPAYYEDLPRRIGPIAEPLAKLADLGILVDRDEDGYLLQIFTQPVEDRPTLFFEIIQRKGCRGFGKGNFKALFESIEREQARRGNL